MSSRNIQLRSYVQDYIRSRPIPEIKLVTASLVLGLVTALEYEVLQLFLFCILKLRFHFAQVQCRDAHGKASRTIAHDDESISFYTNHETMHPFYMSRGRIHSSPNTASFMNMHPFDTPWSRRWIAIFACIKHSMVRLCNMHNEGGQVYVFDTIAAMFDRALLMYRALFRHIL